MRTPICNFVKRYTEKNSIRLHMPGHKGKTHTDDITEIHGIDGLYLDSGIILESEQNASSLFGSEKTCYSTEGSSQCIKTMLHLAKMISGSTKRGTVIAGRNAHSAFISAACLVDFDVKWIYGKQNSYLSCDIDENELEGAILGLEEKPIAVYLTSPDYLGNTLDIKAISQVCKKHGVMLLIDNAHGAYTKFLWESEHPLDLGADMCCDSAHKTLSVLTGGAYLHISKDSFFKEELCAYAKGVMSLYGSTSPSFPILCSLDLMNREIATGGYKDKLLTNASRLSLIKKFLEVHGYSLIGNEALKLTIDALSFGYTGQELNAILEKNNIFCEFFDNSLIVLMISHKTEMSELEYLETVLLDIPKKEIIIKDAPPKFDAVQEMTIRDAMYSKKELVPVDKSLGRIFASPTLSCPPAVSIMVCGEKITSEARELLSYYGINEVLVVK